MFKASFVRNISIARVPPSDKFKDRNRTAFAILFPISGKPVNYIMPPIPPAPPAGIAGAGSLILPTRHSVVRSVEATLVAF
jgi:hypothetical protein